MPALFWDSYSLLRLVCNVLKSVTPLLHFRRMSLAAKDQPKYDQKHSAIEKSARKSQLRLIGLE
jgi:hypothetical protein